MEECRALEISSLVAHELVKVPIESGEDLLSGYLKFIYPWGKQGFVINIHKFNSNQKQVFQYLPSKSTSSYVTQPLVQRPFAKVLDTTLG